MDPQPSSLPPPGGSVPPPAGGSVPPPGAPVPAQPPPAWEPDEPAGSGWWRSIMEARASYAFLAVAVILYGLCIKDANLPLSSLLLLPVPDTIAVQYGAYHYGQIRDHGEWWRFLSTLFVSRTGLDSIIYLMIFWQLGPQLERALGTARFCVLYLGAGAGGVAIAELLDPSTRLNFPIGDTIVAVYAVLGAIPGLIFGLTGSLKRTIASPEARSAVFTCVFFTFIRYAVAQRLESSIVGAAILGLFLAAGLALSKRSKGPGAAATVVPLLLIVVLIGAVTNNMRFRNGKLEDRGSPATGRAPQRQPDPVDGELVPETTEPPPSALEPPETSNAAVTEMREKVAALMDVHGPLPQQFGYKAKEQEAARSLLAEATKVVNGPNNVLYELDPERIKLSIVTASFHEAGRIAEDLVRGADGPYARALAGLAAFYKPNLEVADDHFFKAVADERFVLEVPETLYYYARVREERDGLEAAAATYERYLRTVADGPYPAWRKPLVESARSKLGR